MRDALPTNSIYHILEDSQGTFWISSPTGVFSGNRRDFDEAANGRPAPIHVVPYGVSDGMETSQMNGGFQSAGCKTRSGELWFPSVKGAVRINPSHAPPTRPTPVLLTT